MRMQTIFEAPLAHEASQRIDYCTCPDCRRARESSRAAQWMAQAAQEGDLFNTQLDFRFTRTKEGHEVLTRMAAARVPGVDLAALLRGVTRPDKGTGTLRATLSSLVHSVDPPEQKRHALRRTRGTSTTAALSEIRNHLLLLHSRALSAGRAGNRRAMFEWIGEGLHLIQDSYSQAHTARDNINIVSAPHPIRKVRFFGFVRRFPPSFSQYPDEHQVIRGMHVGDPRDDINRPGGGLKPEAQIAIQASREYLSMVLAQVGRPPSPNDAAELRAFMDWHLSSSPRCL